MSVTTTLLSTAVKQIEAAYQAVVAVRFGLFYNDAELTDIAWRLDGIKKRLEAKLESVTSTKVESNQEKLEFGE